jgi:hypothetical protein
MRNVETAGGLLRSWLLRLSLECKGHDGESRHEAREE